MRKNSFRKSIYILVFLVCILIGKTSISTFSVRTKAIGIVDDGVYVLQNKNYTGYYLDIQSDSYKTNMYIQVYNYGSDPSSDETRSGLFKFSHQGSNYYLIRTMRNNANTFVRTENDKVRTKSVEDTNSYWELSDAGDNYYYIKDSVTGKYLCSPLSVSDKYCTTETTTDDRAKWALREYEGATISGVNIRYLKPHIMDMGSDRLLSANDIETVYFYTTDMNTNDPGTITGYSLKSPGTNNTSNIAYLSGNYICGMIARPGMVTVNVNFSTLTSSSFNIYFKPIYGEYFFLQNTDGINGEDLGYVKAKGTYSEKTDFDYDDKQIWARISAGSGYYYIKNMSGKYLTAPASTLTSLNIGLESSLLSEPDRSRQKWKFENVQSGSSALKIKSENTGNLNLYLNIDPFNNKLIQHTYNNDNLFFDEFNVVMLGNNVVYHRTFEDVPALDPLLIPNTVKNLNYHYNGFELIHLQNHLGNNEDAYDDDACFNIALNMLENSKVIIFAGHGSPSVITVSELNKQYYLRNKHIYENGSIDLSNVDIVIFDGCSTAAPPDSGLLNLPDSAEVAGAKVAIGWTVDVSINQPAYWINNLFEYMNTQNDDTGHLYTANEALIAVNADTNNSSRNAKISGTYIDFSFE